MTLSSTDYKLIEGDALLVVDMQRDFMPGGALAVPDAAAIVPIVDRVIDLFCLRGLPVFLSRDWHPPNHCSFVAQGGPWPPHCVAESSGANFAVGLTIPATARIVSKATDANRDAYSAFTETSLADDLSALCVRRVFVCGVATEYCVRASVNAACDAGFRVVVIDDAIRAVEPRSEGPLAIKDMLARGAHVTAAAAIHV